MQKEKIIALLVFVIIIGIIVGVIILNNKKPQENVTENINVTKTEDDLILIKGGTFTMGSPESETQREDDELEHQITLNDFYAAQYEVTQEEYEIIMGTNPSNFKGEKLPVENITWYEAIEYCNKLSIEKGLTPVYAIDGENITWDKSANGYRLPTEAEWEYMARAGTTTPFNTENSISAEEANYYGHYPYLIEENYFSQGNLDTKPGVYRQTTITVGSFNANKWGLYDVHGNVREWCFDYYGEYDIQNEDNPVGSITGTRKVVRGGGWNDYAKHMRSAYRSSMEPYKKESNTGFRIVRNATDVESTTVNSSNESKNSISSDSKVLIVYFSWGGNTEGIAEEINSKIDADMFEIQLVDPYSSSYNTVLNEAQRDMNNDARPEIRNKISNIDDYDVIMLGYPNWWATIPMPIATFIEEYDLSGKIILPFCSHGGGGLGQSLNHISKLSPNATIGEALSIHYSGGSSLSNDISEWLGKNNISEK